jgi:putative molybdopterin biosynthesis protein
MQSIDQFQQLKALGDRQRLAILRRLMAAPATLTQLGECFHETPAHIRHHLKALEQAGLVELDAVHLVRNLYEKYYRASSAAYQVNLVILPEPPAGQTPLVIGSNDIALQRLQAGFRPLDTGVTPVVLSLDSLEGLVKLREGICRMATCHLLDAAGPKATGSLKAAGNAEYNRAYIRCLFPGQAMALIHIYHREGGLLVPAGNPRHIHGLADLAQAGVSMVNRECGSGMRVWLDDQLGRLGIPAAGLKGYQNEVSSHLAVAQAVSEGRADAGLGLHTCAAMLGLEFIPLFDEPYDLALSQATLADARLAPFFNYLTSGDFRQAVEKIVGYRVPADSGRVDLIS